jgi:hypothetical protein
VPPELWGPPRYSVQEVTIEILSDAIPLLTYFQVADEAALRARFGPASTLPEA